jgi:tetratricopeptide (TPR) repeat protein
MKKLIICKPINTSIIDSLSIIVMVSIFYFSLTPFADFPFELTAPILIPLILTAISILILGTVAIFKNNAINLPSFNSGLFFYAILIMLVISLFQTGITIWWLYFLNLSSISLLVFNLKVMKLMSLEKFAISLIIVLLVEIIKITFFEAGYDISILKSLSNDNIRAMFIILTLPILLSFFKDKVKLQLACLLGSLLICIFLECRTAIFGFIIILFFYIYRLKCELKKYYTFIIPIIIIGVISIYIISISKIESTTGRLIIWEQSLKSINSYFIGTGFNSFEKVFSKQIMNFFSGDVAIEIKDNFKTQINIAYNDMIQLFIENGVFGISLIISILIFIKRQWGFTKFDYLLPIVFILMAVVNSPLYAAPCGILLSFYMGYYFESTGSKATLITLFIAFLILIYTSFYTNSIIETKSLTNNGRMKNINVNTKLSMLKKHRYLLENNSYYWQIVGKIFLENKNYDLSQKALLKSVNIDLNVNSLMILSEVYRIQAKYDKQEETLSSACRIIPGSVITNYELFNFYKYHKNIENSKKIANHILQLENNSNRKLSQIFNSLKEQLK